MKIPHVFLLVFLVFSSAITAQSKDYTRDLLKVYDSLTGYTNSSLLNGVEYIEQYRSRGQHQFFLQRDYIDGDLVYDGQEFYGIGLKYDIFSDRLIAKLDENINGSLIMELIKEKVQGFTISGHHFRNISTGNKPESGYHEVILDLNGVMVFKKLRLKAREIRERQLSSYEFEEMDNEYILYREDLGYVKAEINILKDELPSCADRIEDFKDSNRRMKKQNLDNYMKGLGTLVAGLPCTKNQEF